MKSDNTMKNTEHILHLLKHITDNMKKTSNELLQDNDLTMAQGQILRLLNKSEGKKLPLKEIEKSLHVAQSTSAGLVSRLEKKGFIKTFNATDDKRVKMATMTKQSEDTMENVRTSFEELEKTVFENFSENDKNLLVELLTKLNINLNKENS